MGASVELDISTYGGALHICFTQSGGGILRQALRATGLEPIVIATSDNLSFGPINPPDSQSRVAWLQREFDECDYADDWEWLAKEIDDFWSITLAAKWERRVVWFSRRSAMEYCCFLEWVRRSGPLNYNVIDLIDTKVSSRFKDGSFKERLVESLGMAHLDSLPLTALLQNSHPLTARESNDYINLWAGLQDENAPFRIVGDFGLKSAPLNYFDHLLLSRVTTDWRKSAWVVGYALADSFDSGYHQVGDLPLFGRLRALVKAGVLDARGDLTKMQLSEVRLKQP